MNIPLDQPTDFILACKTENLHLGSVHTEI